MNVLDRRRLPVWAPAAERVEAVLAARRLAMRPAGDGWWLADEAVGPGTDYRFSLDGS